MTPNLPPWLRSAIEQLVQTYSTQDLSVSSANITHNYRNLKPSNQTIVKDADGAAYCASRMPATYAAISASLAYVLRRLPEFKPITLLDIGAGPGTASFVAEAQLPSLQSFTLLDDNAPFLNIAKQLMIDAPPPLRQAQILDSNIIKSTEFPKSDLILAGYSLVELPVSTQSSLVQRLWQTCTGVLLIVEPGTPKAYQRLMVLRDQLIAQGAHVVAPCMGQGACPLSAPDWCHFSQRLARSRAHMQAKGAHVPFEDEKFSYLAVSRTQSQMSGFRILAPPKESKGAIEFKLCADNGLKNRLIPSRDKQAYKQVRKLGWGDVIA